jgi:hypothetical protein
VAWRWGDKRKEQPVCCCRCCCCSSRPVQKQLDESFSSRDASSLVTHWWPLSGARWVTCFELNALMAWENVLFVRPTNCVTHKKTNKKEWKMMAHWLILPLKLLAADWRSRRVASLNTNYSLFLPLLAHSFPPPSILLVKMTVCIAFGGFLFFFFK